MNFLVAIGHVAQHIAATLGFAVLHGTAVASLAWLVVRGVPALQKRFSGAVQTASPTLVAAVWAMVLVKFVMPVGPGMPWSLSDIIEWLRRTPASSRAPEMKLVLAASPRAAVVTTSALIFAMVATVIVVLWAVIVVRRFAASIAAHRRAVACARALPTAPDHIVAIATAIARSMTLRHTPRIVVEHTGHTPHVIGLRAPIIVLPASLIDRTAALTSVLRHEIAHVRRRDPWMATIATAAQHLFFFWPVVAMSARAWATAREAACDAWVFVDGADISPAAYARLLLEFSGATHHLALSGSEFAGALGIRVDHVLVGGVRARLGRGGVAMVATWGVLTLGGARAVHASGNALTTACRYSNAIAASLMAAHPEADLNGDGHLSRGEVCDFESQVRRRIVDESVASGTYDERFDLDDDGVLDADEDALMRSILADGVSTAQLARTSPLLAEPLYCNSQAGEGTSSPAINPLGRALSPATSCVEGASP